MKGSSGEYRAQLPKATQLLDTLVSMDETIAGKFKLLDLLTVPVQRILKYHMLLQRLVGQTKASHETRSTSL